MSRAPQPDLFPAGHSKPRAPAPARERLVVDAFEFTADGPECIPDPSRPVPEWLELPTDQPGWMPKFRIG